MMADNEIKVPATGFETVEYFSSYHRRKVILTIESDIPVYCYIVGSEGLNNYKFGRSFEALAGNNQCVYNQTLIAYIPKDYNFFLLFVNTDAKIATITWDIYDR